MATITTSKRWDRNYSIYAQIDYSTSTSNTAVTVNVSLMRICPDVGWDNDQWAFKYYTSNNGGQTNISNSASYGYQYYQTWTQVLGAQSRSFARKTSAYTVTLTVAFQTQWSSWYTGSVNITVPALASYAVKFYGNGATSGSTAAQTKYYGTNLTLNANGFSKTGYEFIGWNTSSSATSASYANKGTYTGNAAINLYAIWRKTIIVTYDANGGSGAPSVSTGYAYNSTTSTSITIPNTAPIRTGYSTDGWASSASGAKAYNKNTAYTFSDSTTIYAHWNPITYNISYDLTGGALPSGQTNPATYNIETDTFTLKEPTKQYYEFIGWTGSNGNTPTKNLSISQGSIGDRNYIANWRSTWEIPKINIVTVRRASDSVDDDPSGERLYLDFTWAPGQDTTDIQNPIDIDPVSYELRVEGSDGTIQTKTYNISPSPIQRKYDVTDISLGITVSYKVILIVTTTNYPDVVINDFISEAYFIMDINEDGTAIAFGKPANDSGYFDCNLKVRTQDNSTVFRAIFDIMYPVGSWYSTSLRPKLASGETGTNMVDYFDPTEAWGGTWELLDEGIVLTSAGANYPITGGTAKNGGDTTYTVPTTTLSDANIAHGHGFTNPTADGGSHNHYVLRQHNNNGSDSAYVFEMTGSAQKYADIYTGYEGGHTHSVYGGSVHDLYGASSTRTAHGHGSVSTMQPYKNAYWWHRTA